MSEENPSVCFVEGFRFKTRLEALENNMNVFRHLQETLLTPQQIEIRKDMEQMIRKQIQELTKVKYASPELEQNITWNARMVEHNYNEALTNPRNWRKVDEYLTYLEVVIEGW